MQRYSQNQSNKQNEMLKSTPVNQKSQERRNGGTKNETHRQKNNMIDLNPNLAIIKLDTTPRLEDRNCQIRFYIMT